MLEWKFQSFGSPDDSDHGRRRPGCVRQVACCDRPFAQVTWLAEAITRRRAGERRAGARWCSSRWAFPVLSRELKLQADRKALSRQVVDWTVFPGAAQRCEEECRCSNQTPDPAPDCWAALSAASYWWRVVCSPAPQTPQGPRSPIARRPTVTVQDTGVLWRAGKVVDSTWQRGFAESFMLGYGRVQPGWEQDLARLPMGSSVLLMVPPSTGYGSSGNPLMSRPRDTVVFVIDIVAAQTAA